MAQNRPFIGSALFCALLVLGGAVAPASADAPTSLSTATVDSSTTLHVEGTIVVLSGRKADRGAQVATLLPQEVRLLTPAGHSLVITGSLTEDATTGSAFTGTLAVPADVAVALNAEVEKSSEAAVPGDGAAIDGQSPLGETILAASATLGAPLAVTAATMTLPVVGAIQTATAHTLDVVVVRQSSAPSETVISDTTVGTLVQTLSTYWVSQSNGQVSGVSKPLAVQHRDSPNACNPDVIWTEAAAGFGHTPEWYWAASGAHHLIVIAPTSCGAGSGLGTVGALSAGGLVWASYDNVVGTSTVAHEFGHNVGLHHSNLHECPNPVVEGALVAPPSTFGDGCSDSEYSDYYDIMGGGLEICSSTCFSNAQLMALNVTQKAVLGSLSDGDLPTVNLSAGVTSSVVGYTLNPASSLSGLRGLRVVDPRTADEYFIEYRSGTGIDSGSIYARSAIPGYGAGVRILRLRSDDSSAVLTVPNAVGTRALFLAPGQLLTARSGGVKVLVSGAGATAAVSVMLTSSAPQTLTAGTPTITGTPETGNTLTAVPGAWSPAPLSFAYQWFRDGTPVSGATEATYALDAADLDAAMAVAVTGSRTGYVSATRTSVATTAITAPWRPTVTRISGADRYSTAVAIATAGYPGIAPVVYLATGANYPDALAAAPAAAKQGGPLLLSPPDALPDSVFNKIGSLKPARIIIVGGEAALSPAVFNRLAQWAQAQTPPATVTRLAGADRFETSRKVVAGAFTAPVASAYIATALNYPDALSASAAAGAIGVPVVLVNGPAAAVDSGTAALLQDLGVATLTVVGGTAAVSDGLASSLSGSTTRISGTDRFDTSRKLNQAAFDKPAAAYFATGYQFPDALAGAALAGGARAPLYVVLPTCVPAGMLADLETSGTSAITLLGGTSALNADVAALRKC